MPQEFNVEFDHIDIKLAENVQRGVSAAEVIDPDALACFPEIFELFFEVVGSLCQVLFGDLDDDAFTRDPVFI